jgi:MarR family transcriptional regulator, lower aerobic nicotinate degradation pathway regulator
MQQEDETTALNDIVADLIESNGFLIAVLGQESRRRFMAHVNQWDLGWPHQSVLGALLNAGPDGTASQKRLSAYVHIDPRNLVAILDTLEERKLIERAPNPQDRRSYGIRLTQSGAHLARELRAAGAQLERDFFAGLTQAEQDGLHQLLLKLYREIEGSKDDKPAE